ncbi:Anaphase promoting complex, Cdc20, Cdh1, and Ama1 subunits [Pseudoloma neurophilia]|uniref:Anaphase promoting complex, Cdc20, Cdh1, and Ama1 subunits n=1 Tax=Pseudoloma neurophilia TaxID=146866 RepID=A0A0R0LUV0_9MICR|nr:Anaphase promoting complex, Cdc20, Cdh1, and Ama1 subunits [Pseudoloma neurophilia]
MRPLSLGDIFNTEPRYKRTNKRNKISNDIFQKESIIGFKTDSLIKTVIFDEPRYKRLEKRQISHNPYKILDAPGIINDYYLNVLDWSEKDIISIGLSSDLYIYDVKKKSVTNLHSLEEGKYFSSVKSNGNTLSSGTSSGEIILFDILAGKEITRIKNHNNRIAISDWNENILTTGSRDGKIINFDIRDNKIINKWEKHSQEICGLKWSNNKKYLASGSNDNMLYIWQIGCNSPRYNLNEHSSAVKALDWCPWKTDILASGGGSNDKTVRFWDISTGKCEKKISVNSQVCGLHFINKFKEIVTTHGFSENNICLWKESNLKKVASFGKHDDRVLYSALSPDQSTLISLSADENLKFWKLFDNKNETETIETSEWQHMR